MVTWLIPASVDQGIQPSLLRESGCPNAFAFYIKLQTEQFPASSPEPSLGKCPRRVFLGIGEEDGSGPMTTVGVTYDASIGRSSIYFTILLLCLQMESGAHFQLRAHLKGKSQRHQV